MNNAASMSLIALKRKVARFYEIRFSPTSKLENAETMARAYGTKVHIFSPDLKEELPFFIVRLEMIKVEEIDRYRTDTEDITIAIFTNHLEEVETIFDNWLVLNPNHHRTYKDRWGNLHGAKDNDTEN